MAVQRTSVESYDALKDQGILGIKQIIVYDYISKNKDSSDREMALGLGFTINQITGRRNELVDMGLVEESLIKHDPTTNRNVIGWRCRPFPLEVLIKNRQTCAFCNGQTVLGLGANTVEPDSFSIGLELMFSDKTMFGERMIRSGKYIHLRLSDVKKLIEEHEKKVR